MNCCHFTVESVLAAPKQSLLYLVSNDSSRFVLKTPRISSASLKEAYEDEFETLKEISHPVLPRYYAYYEDILLPGNETSVPGLLMEYVEGVPLSSIEHLTTKQLKKYILDLADGLFTLLANGVLYTDLHAGNLIITGCRIRLLDFTQAYYFLRNPYPSYTPKISYQLDQNLKGQKLLIQALTLLLLNLPKNCSIKGIPPSLLQFGSHPQGNITFPEFINELSSTWEVSDNL